MKKMRTLFVQDERYQVVDKLRKENEFINGGKFTVYRKRDGSSVLIINNTIYKRYDANEKKGRKVPENAIPCQDKPAPNGSFPVWVECDRNNPEDKFHFEAFDKNKCWDDGTYELCGPKVNGNKEKLDSHILIPHNAEVIDLKDLSFDSIKNYLSEHCIEGLIVKNNKNGFLTKIRRKDYGMKW